MFLILPMMLLTFADVFSRKFFHRPLPGTVELSEYMLASFILLGIAYTQQINGNAQLTLLHRRLSRRTGIILDTVTTSLSLIVAVLLCWQGFVVAAEEEAVSEVLRIPQQPFKMLVACAALLLALELITQLTEHVRKALRR